MNRYKLEELAREADVSPRTVRYYVQRGLIPPPDFKGSHTTYGPEHLLRLRLIRRFQQEHLPLEAIQSRLANAAVGDLEQMLVDQPALAPAPLPACLPAPSQPSAQQWDRLELLPGLELHVRSDAGPVAQRMAQEIRRHYANPAYRPEESS